MSPATYFPLRWESTGEQWWYASPIDWAAANGHYDLVRELLRLDGNHLIQLTSLRRIRRLETVWDDEAQFHDVATCRSGVARKLLSECEMKKGRNSLIGGGYGGWVLYTAASAGDMRFVRELLERDPLLVFGEGEYGVTDILYAAARSKDSDVFKVVLDYAAAPRLGGEEQIPAAYRVEIMNRAIHAAARGGNLGLLKELLGDDDALAYRDVQGATVLHAAAARGQVEVVRDVASCCGGVVDARDNEGNTALHAAAQRGHLGVVEALILASPSSITATNNAGDTFLHAVVAGFQTPGFRRLDRQIELMKHLLSFPAAAGAGAGVERIINARNKQGKTALHLAITVTPNSNLVQLLMTLPSIDVNIRDLDGLTPLDILRQQRPGPSSELLTRQLISAGGIFSSQDYSARRVIASHIKRQSMGSSPGTSFRISDVEIFLYTGLDNGSPSPTVAFTSYSPPQLQVAGLSQTPKTNAAAAAAASTSSSAAQRLKRLLRLHWTKMSKEKLLRKQKQLASDSEEVMIPLPLRQRYSSNKRALSVRSGSGSSQPSPTPTAKKKQANHRSRSSSFSNSKMSFSSHSSLDMAMGNGNGNGKASCSSSTTNPNPNPNPNPIDEGEGVIKRSHLHKRAAMNQYLCFGGPSGGGVETELQLQPYEIYERSVLAAA